MSLPEKKTYCVWANVPHWVHVEAESKEEAMKLAVKRDEWEPVEGYEPTDEDIYDAAELDKDGQLVEEDNDA